MGGSDRIIRMSDPARARQVWLCQRCQFHHAVTNRELVQAYAPEPIVRAADERASGHDCNDYEQRAPSTPDTTTASSHDERTP